MTAPGLLHLNTTRWRSRVAAAGLAREGRFAGQKTNFGRRN